MSIESKVGRILHDSNDVIKNRITSNISTAIQNEQIDLPAEVINVIVHAANTAVDDVGLNVAGTIARLCSKTIEENSKQKPTKGRRRK